MKSVLLVADQPVVVSAIRLALRNSAAFRVVATVDGRGSARPSLTEHGHDVVLVDEMCQRTNALARLQEASEAAPGATIMLLAICLDPAWLGDAFAAGAHAVVSRRLNAATLGTLLREVVHGTVVLAPSRPLTASGPPARRHAHLRALSDQEARTSA